MKRTLSIVLVICLMLSVAALFAGCGEESGGPEYPVTIGGVTIDKEPQNVVVLNDDLADIISYIGYDIKMVGRSTECDQDFLHVVPEVGSAASPDLNAISNAAADLVIADSTLNANTKQSLESAGIKVLTMNPPTGEEELLNTYIDLGKALGGNVTGAGKGEKGYNDLFNMLDTLNTATSSVVQTAAYLYLDGSGQLCTFVKGSLEYKIFSFNGCTNVFLNQAEPVVKTEELRVGSPKYIFFDNPAVLDVVKTDPSLAKVDAMVNGHALMIPLKQFRRHGSTAEQTVFDMLNYIEKISKATADEATVAPTQAPTTAPKAAVTEAPAEEETAEEAVTDAEVQTDAAVSADGEVQY